VNFAAQFGVVRFYCGAPNSLGPVDSPLPAEPHSKRLAHLLHSIHIKVGFILGHESVFLIVG